MVKSENSKHCPNDFPLTGALKRNTVLTNKMCCYSDQASLLLISAIFSLCFETVEVAGVIFFPLFFQIPNQVFTLKLPESEQFFPKALSFWLNLFSLPFFSSTNLAFVTYTSSFYLHFNELTFLHGFFHFSLLFRSCKRDKVSQSSGFSLFPSCSFCFFFLITVL